VQYPGDEGSDSEEREGKGRGLLEREAMGGGDAGCG